MPAPEILIIEDEDSLAETLRLNLSLEGYRVKIARNGRQALEASGAAEKPDLVLLDVMLPDMDGHAICAAIKERHPLLPVIFLTARSQRSDKIEGLKMADDYITKPFDLDELLLRIGNMLKRYQPRAESGSLEFGNCAVNFSTFEARTASGEHITLSRRESALLRLLSEEPGKVVSRDEIISKLWDPGENPSSRTIDNFILAFRKYFEKDPKRPAHFHSIRGVGYKFLP